MLHPQPSILAPATDNQPPTTVRNSPYLPQGASWTLVRLAHPEVLVEGPAGTGKTRGILEKINALCAQFPGLRVLLLRATRTRLTHSVLVTLEENVLKSGHPALAGNVQRERRSAYRYPNGSIIVPGGLDEGDRWFSTEWDIIYVAEATEISENEWEKLGRAMRHFRGPYHQRIADCNPGAPGHWLNLRADPCDDGLRLAGTREQYERLQKYNVEAANGRMKRLVSRHMDNPLYWNKGQWDWTNLGRAYVLGELARLSGYRRARLHDGLWKGADGTVFGADFDEAVHAIAPFDIPRDWPMVVGFDPGYDHPAAVLWLAVAPNEIYYVCDEIYRGGLAIPQIADAIHAHNAGRTILRYYGDPQHVFSHTQQSPRSIAQQFQAAAHATRFVPWPRTGDSEAAMVEAVRQRLHSSTLKVFRTCVNTIREFQTWSYRRKKGGEIPAGNDRFEDRDNHAMDVIKGLVAANPRYRRGVLVLEGE